MLKRMYLYRSHSTWSGTALERNRFCDTIFGTIKRNNDRNQRTSSQWPIVHSSCNIRRVPADCQNSDDTQENRRRFVHVLPGTTEVRLVQQEESEKTTIWPRIIVVGVITIIVITHSLLVHVVVLHQTVSEERQTDKKRGRVDVDCLLPRTVVRLANICCGWLWLVLYLNRLSAVQ